MKLLMISGFAAVALLAAATTTMLQTSFRSRSLRIWRWSIQPCRSVKDGVALGGALVAAQRSHNAPRFQRGRNVSDD